MAYTPCYPNKRNWANLPSESSPINETNLNAMDNAIYTNDGRIVELSGRLDTDETALGNKVDKQSGKGLSEIKSITISPSVNTGTKIAEISYKNQDNLTIGYEIKNGVVVDSALSSSSENPVQNKVVKSAVDAKSTVSISDTLVTGDTIANLTIDGTTTAIKAPLVEVDDTPSATSENPLQNKAIYEMLNNLLPEETAEGNPIAISDASGLNAKACSVDLLPIQDLSHGEPSPTNICPISGRDSVTVKRTGKNLLNNTVSSSVISDVTFTVNNDWTVKANGTASAEALFIIPINLPIGNYYASGCADGGSSSLFDVFFYNNTTRARIKQWDGTTNSVSLLDSNTSAQIKIDSTTDVFQYRIRIKNGVTVNNVVFKPMIRLATETDNTYEPYQGETVIVQLGQTVYGGTLDLTSGKLTIDTAFQQTTWGDMGAGTSLGDNVRKTLSLSAAGSRDLRFNSICNIAPYKEGSFTEDTNKFMMNNQGTQMYVYAPSATDSSQSVQICYPLATPIEITLTAEQISLLKGINVLSTDGDNIKLVYSADIGLYIAGQLQNS